MSLHDNFCGYWKPINALLREQNVRNVNMNSLIQDIDAKRSGILHNRQGKSIQLRACLKPFPVISSRTFFSQGTE